MARKNTIEMIQHVMKESLLLLKDSLEPYKIYRYINSVSKNVYIVKLDDIANKYNNTCYTTIKTKLIDVKLNTYIDSSRKSNNKNLKFKIGEIVRIYIIMFLQTFPLQIGPTTFLRLKKLKILCRGQMLLMILIVGTFMRKN